MNNWQKLIKSLYDYTFKTENELENYNNNKYPKVGKLYSGRALPTGEKLLIDVRNFYTLNDLTIPKINSTNITYDKIAKASLIYVHEHITYVPDKEQVKLPEYWMFPFETLQTKQGDCEDGAILLANILINSGIPYWRVRVLAGNVKTSSGTGGHAYCCYLSEETNEWIILDWCMVDRKDTQVSTTTGKKRFKKLKIGDEVISFNETTKKIETSKISYLSNRKVNETYKIFYLNSSGREQYMECTGEHPFYVKNKWVPAKDLKVNDELYAISPRSLYAIAGNHKKTKEWSMKIANVNRKNGVYKQLSKRQTGNSNVAKRLEVRKKLSENNCMKDPAMVERVWYKRLQKGWKSQPEIKFIDLIEKLNLPVDFVGDGSFWVNGKNPDFKVRDEKKVIEITQYGYLKRDEKYARERIEHFKKHGFKCGVFFYDLKNKPLFTVNDIISFVMNGYKITKIKKLNSERTVYNMRCEPNNNYFVNGVLVHNCFYYNESIQWLKWKDAKRYTNVWFSFNTKYSYSEDRLDRENIVTEKKIK